MSINLPYLGGATVHRKVAANTTNATNVKAGPGAVWGGWVHNSSAAAKFLKFYNKATAPTVGTDTPYLTIPIAIGATVPLNTYGGIRFDTGISYAMTGAVADSDTTALAANDVVLNLLYT